MRRLLAAIVLVAMTITMFGCSATLSQTGKQREARIKRDMAKDWKLAAEDWDRFWLADRPSRLTPNNM